MFYEPGTPHALFARKDANRALAKMIFIKDEDLTRMSLVLVSLSSVLQEWENNLRANMWPLIEESKPIGTAEATGVIRGDAKDAQSGSVTTKTNKITTVGD